MRLRDFTPHCFLASSLASSFTTHLKAVWSKIPESQENGPCNRVNDRVLIINLQVVKAKFLKAEGRQAMKRTVERAIGGMKRAPVSARTLRQRLDRKCRLAGRDGDESLTLKAEQMLLLLELLHLEELLLEDKLLGGQLLLLLLLVQKTQPGERRGTRGLREQLSDRETRAAFIAPR